MFIKTVHYKGSKVAMKDVNYTSLTRSLLMELKILKDLNHVHIVRFLGACFNQGKSPFTLKVFEMLRLVV